MRFILLSVVFSSCASIPRGDEKKDFILVISQDGNGIFATKSESLNVRVSLVIRGNKRDFEFHNKVFFGYGSKYGFLMDSTLISIYTTKFDSGDSVGVLIGKSYFGIRFPGEVEISEPNYNALQDWNDVSISWVGDAKSYIVRVYAFTLMDQRDFLKTVDERNIKIELSDMYGDGFLAFQICPLNELKRIFVVGRCKQRVILVGDTTIWEGEVPKPLWKNDDVLWYLINF